MKSLKGRSFLTLKDFTTEEILALLHLSLELKAKKKGASYDAALQGKLLAGKNIVLIFDKSSTRTRCSFEVAAFDEGAQVTFLTNSQMGKKESIEDTAKVLGRLYDGIQYRGFSPAVIREIAQHSQVPVWNGLTDDDHPTQVLADVLTAMEHTGKDPKQLKFAYIGDGRNNVSNALMIGAAKLGMEYRIAAPKELFPEESLLASLAEDAKQSGAKIVVTTDPYEAVQGVDVIYTDVWVSMGEEDQTEKRVKLLKDYQVTMDLLKASSNPEVLFEHCLPSFHDLNTTVAQQIHEQFGLSELEVTDEVFRSSHSVVFDEAENRMHTIKAVMVATLTDLL
ncbi:MAG: ornithine carbamoyltransferase [Spirochaetia bacterium]|uniref:ornithine carbamoyltransferase n=1 Tax=Sphaerochaeta sp. TaxID=1972642 RepID=UPI001D912F8A|nr:ornithine carbamoyltransferase [uncultured Sphaerochaeta sp.]MDD3056764.1 ornithine carbamoyltransferase [Sphaerochaeta sp.]NCC12327.1 ornithine carbamoyltransferase [Spirochaetia bacterium]NCC89164.1 ornithine carbamoyltransferase [Spirochaetia bacterium]